MRDFMRDDEYLNMSEKKGFDFINEENVV